MFVRQLFQMELFTSINKSFTKAQPLESLEMQTCYKLCNKSITKHNGRLISVCDAVFHRFYDQAVFVCLIFRLGAAEERLRDFVECMASTWC